MLLLTKEKNSYYNKNFVIYVKKQLVMMIKNAIKFKIIVFIPENLEALDIISVVT